MDGHSHAWLCSVMRLMIFRFPPFWPLSQHFQPWTVEGDVLITNLEVNDYVTEVAAVEKAIKGKVVPNNVKPTVEMPDIIAKKPRTIKE